MLTLSHYLSVGLHFSFLTFVFLTTEQGCLTSRCYNIVTLSKCMDSLLLLTFWLMNTDVWRQGGITVRVNEVLPTHICEIGTFFNGRVGNLHDKTIYFVRERYWRSTPDVCDLYIVCFILYADYIFGKNA